MDANSWDILGANEVASVRGRDSILTEFIDHTHVEPALASDLLDATGWDLSRALSTFEGMKDVCVEHVGVDEPAPLRLSSREGGVARGKGSRPKRRGLVGVGEEAMEEFYKAARSVSVVKSEEQVTIEEQYFADSFRCPDFSQYDKQFQGFLADDIIEKSHKYALEKAGVLNWWTSTGKLPQLEPLATSGDGNCLLHAASLYMWGIQDRQLILRNALHKLLTSGTKKDAIFKRWRHQTELRNKDAGGLTFSEEEWSFEWAEIVRIANSKPRRAPSTESLRRYSTLRLNYESLEEIHVFALAHVLRRPVVVIADKVLRGVSGDELAPVYFGGIYLPLEEKRVAACCKYPLILTYDASHFAALVAKEGSPAAKSGGKRVESVIPLVTSDGKPLPVWFNNEEVPALGYDRDEYDPQTLKLLEMYFDLRWIQLAGVHVKSSHAAEDDDYDHLVSFKVPNTRFPAAFIGNQQTPPYQQTLIRKYIEDARVRFEEGKLARQQEEEKGKRDEERSKEKEMRRPVPCRGKDCTMFGTAATKYLCSRCSKLSQTEGVASVPPWLPDVATPSPSVVNLCQIPGPARQSSRSEGISQPSQHTSTSKEIPSGGVLLGAHHNSSTSKVQVPPPSSPKPVVVRQDSSKPQVLESQNVHVPGATAAAIAPAGQPRKAPLEVPKKPLHNSQSSPTKDNKFVQMHLETKADSAVSSPASSPTKPYRVLSVRPSGPSGSYSRDNIPPLTANDKGDCATKGCTFYRSEKSIYCTKCRAIQTANS